MAEEDAMRWERVKWHFEGDENSKLFHAMVRRSNRKSGFTGLMVDGQ